MREERSKPTLPRELTRVSVRGSAATIAYALAMYLLPWLAYGRIWASGTTMALRVCAVAPLVFLSAQGLHLLGWVGHEGFHFNLSRNKMLSAAIGTFFGSMVVGLFPVGMNTTHQDHHRYTNRKGDPDCELLSRYTTVFARLVRARMNLSRRNLRTVFALALGRPVGVKHPPFNLKAMARYARSDLALTACWFALYVWIARTNSIVGWLGIVLPHALSSVIAAERSYIEHADTKPGAFRDGRTRTSVLSSCLYWFNNYHLEHHLYPGVPCYRLPAVHAYLRGIGAFDAVADAPVAADAAAEVRFVSPKYRYPTASD